jgi:hypothetical protein
MVNGMEAVINGQNRQSAEFLLDFQQAVVFGHILELHTEPVLIWPPPSLPKIGHESISGFAE